MIYGYPLGKSHQGGLTTPDAVYLAPNGNVTVVHMVSGAKLPEDYMDIQDDMFLAVDRKLRASPKMMDGRKMRLAPQTITFGPDLPEPNFSDPEYPVTNTQDLVRALRQFQDRSTQSVTMEDVQEAILASNSNTGFW